MVLSFAIFVLLAHSCLGKDDYRLTVRMPNAVSDKPDALLCTAVKLDPSRRSYIRGFEPHAFSNTTHHMMLYGCGQPGSQEPYWPCGEMDDRSDASVCGDGQRDIVFAWANDAPAKMLPEGVGYRTGGDSSVQYLVLQMHYKETFVGGRTDDSGLSLIMSHDEQPLQLGYYVLGTWGYIPPKTPEFHMETACEYTNAEVMHPIGYRTHAHNLGVVTSGYLVTVKNNDTKQDTWTEMGRMSPQEPQMFYDVSTPGLTISRGDVLTARCTMSSMDRDEVTKIGPTNHDEMCNFYIMYATPSKENLKVTYCFRDAQTFKWTKYFRHIPENASSLEGIRTLWKKH